MNDRIIFCGSAGDFSLGLPFIASAQSPSKSFLMAFRRELLRMILPRFADKSLFMTMVGSMFRLSNKSLPMTSPRFASARQRTLLFERGSMFYHYYSVFEMDSKISMSRAFFGDGGRRALHGHICDQISSLGKNCRVDGMRVGSFIVRGVPKWSQYYLFVIALAIMLAIALLTFGVVTYGATDEILFKFGFSTMLAQLIVFSVFIVIAIILNALLVMTTDIYRRRREGKFRSDIDMIQKKVKLGMLSDFNLKLLLTCGMECRGFKS